MNVNILKCFIKKIIPSFLLKRRQIKLLNKQREMFHSGCLELLFLVDDLLTEASIPYWLNYGTLLGAYRDDDFIPHDYDLDIGLMMEYYQRVKDIMIEKGLNLVFEAHMGGSWDKPDVVEYRFEYLGTFIDFNYYTTKEGGMVHTYDFVLLKDYNYKENKGKRNPILVEGVTSPLAGLKRIVFKGRSFNIPSNTEDYLVANYGPSWRVPVKDFDYHDYAENIVVFDKGDIYGEVISYNH